MDAAVNAFATAADAEAAIFESGATLIDDADELTVDMLSDADFVLPRVSPASVVCPGAAGHRPPKIHFPDLAAAFDRNYRDIEEAVSSPLADGLVNYAKTSCQPELLLLLTSGNSEKRQDRAQENPTQPRIAGRHAGARESDRGGIGCCAAPPGHPSVVNSPDDKRPNSALVWCNF